MEAMVIVLIAALGLVLLAYLCLIAVCEIICWRLRLATRRLRQMPPWLRQALSQALRQELRSRLKQEET